MKTIYKYPIEIKDQQKIQVHLDCKFLYAGLDNNNTPCVWAEVDTESQKFWRVINIFGTGNPMPNPVGQYLNSFNQNPFVWHVYIK
jgi:hypothetical protein